MSADFRKIQGPGQQLECMRNIDNRAGTRNSIRAKRYILIEICSAAHSCRIARTLLLVVGLASVVEPTFCTRA